MELMLTSFGLSHIQRHISHYPDTFQRGLGVFHGMPPISMSVGNQAFMPDYPMLILCERLILDAESFERLSKGEHHEGYKSTAEIMKGLFDEGFIRVEDFGAIIDNNKALLERMLEHDLKRLDNWVEPLKESTQTWQRFIKSLTDLLRGNFFDISQEVGNRESVQDEAEIGLKLHQLGYALHGLKNQAAAVTLMLSEAIESSTKRRRSEYRNVLREALTEYLAYVNANLVLSHTLESGFHDWYDFEPFYREKFLTVGQEGRPEEKRIQKVKQLFELSFPEFFPSDAKNMLKMMKDKRISDLRNLVNKAVEEEIQFDREFAIRILQEVFGTEQRIGRLRNIVSYATLPIGFAPLVGTPLQKAVEEVVDRLAESKMRKQYRWFYLISEFGSIRESKKLDEPAQSNEINEG